jgi:hypothetical protein
LCCCSYFFFSLVSADVSLLKEREFHLQQFVLLLFERLGRIVLDFASLGGTVILLPARALFIVCKSAIVPISARAVLLPIATHHSAAPVGATATSALATAAPASATVAANTNLKMTMCTRVLEPQIHKVFHSAYLLRH